MRARRAGFTLIEVLVALVILATIAGVLVVSLPASDERRLRREAERLSAMLALACEQAELSGREIGIHLAGSGYGFSLADREGWLPYAAGHRFAERAIEGAELHAGRQVLPAAVDFDSAPQAVCWPTGELSSMDLRLAHRGQERFRVRTMVDGTARVEVAQDAGHWRALR